MKFCKNIFLSLSETIGRLWHAISSAESSPDTEVQDAQVISASFSTYVQLNSSNY
jgi:hypothetical protein